MKRFFNAGVENSGGQSQEPSDLDQEIIKARFGEEAQKKIKDFRVRIDSFFLTAKKLVPSREVSLAITAFQQARQFCGIMLGEKGAAYPYKSMNEPGPVVGERNEKGAILDDVLSVAYFKESEAYPKNGKEIERLRVFRGKVEDVITDFSIYMEDSAYGSIKEFVAQNEVLKNLMAGKMMLGEQMAILSGAE